MFVATRGDETLVEKHDERGSGQEELYLVLDGEAEFELDGERLHATRGDAPRGRLTPRRFRDDLA